ncbi:transmembrane protein 237B [Polymixia lowei]
MEQRHSKKTRRRDLPPLPQRELRTLPVIPSQDTGEDLPAAKSRKRRQRKEGNGVDDVEGLEMAGPGSQTLSEVGEPLTPEALNDAPPQRRRRKKKAPMLDLEDDKEDLVNGDEPDPNTDGEEVVRKPKKKKKFKVVDFDLDVEEDDIITDDVLPPIPQHSLFSAPQSQSRPIGKVFIEGNKRFQAAERSDRRKTSNQTNNFMDFQTTEPHWTTRDVSISVHEGFRVLGLFCHGFLAGYAVWNMVLVYMLAGQHLTALPNLLQQYHMLAYPSQSLLYLLLAVSTVAAFDRVNLAKGSLALRQFVTLDPVALTSFLYFSALVLSLSQQMTSDRINLYQTSNGTLWPPGSQHQILQGWVTVNLVVALLAGLAWILISTRPEMDYTKEYLMEMKIKPPKPEDKPDMTA